MAQTLKPNRSDNRGGYKPKTSTKEMFSWRVEKKHHELLKDIAVILNEDEDYTSSIIKLMQKLK